MYAIPIVWTIRSTNAGSYSVFFLVNDLFYDIPEIGDINSHEYLVKTSGEYINYNENDELIEALQNEIATLRQELLASQQQLTEQQTPQQ